MRLSTKSQIAPAQPMAVQSTPRRAFMSHNVSTYVRRNKRNKRLRCKSHFIANLSVEEHSLSIAEIYNYYIRSSTCTFEEEPVSKAVMSDRINSLIVGGMPAFVAIDNETKINTSMVNDVIGYAYCAPWNPRTSYRYTITNSIYVRHGYHRSGIGTQLLQTLIAASREKGYKQIIAVIGDVENNSASVALHEKLGFKRVGYFPNVGIKMNRWLSTGYFQKQLDDIGIEKG